MHAKPFRCQYQATRRQSLPDPIRRADCLAGGKQKPSTKTYPGIGVKGQVTLEVEGEVGGWAGGGGKWENRTTRMRKLQPLKPLLSQRHGALAVALDLDPVRRRSKVRSAVPA